MSTDICLLVYLDNTMNENRFDIFVRSTETIRHYGINDLLLHRLV